MNKKRNSVLWGGNIYDAEWRIVIENAAHASDPCEVIYRVCLVSDSGEIIDKDAKITYGEHGLFKRIISAAKKPFMVPKKVVPVVESVVEYKYE